MREYNERKLVENIIVEKIMVEKINKSEQIVVDKTIKLRSKNKRPDA